MRGPGRVRSSQDVVADGLFKAQRARKIAAAIDAAAIDREKEMQKQLQDAEAKRVRDAEAKRVRDAEAKRVRDAEAKRVLDIDDEVKKILAKSRNKIDRDTNVTIKSQDPKEEERRKRENQEEIQQREKDRHSRLLVENRDFQAQLAKEKAQAEAQAKAKREAEAQAEAQAKAKREAEAKARREAEAKAKARKQDNQAKDILSQWFFFATSLSQQNDQKINQQAKTPKKTDDKKENSLLNWVALFSGSLNQQGEKEPKLPPQTNPPSINTQREKSKVGQKIATVTTTPSNPISQPPTRAPDNYSHSLDIYRLQSKFDENHNISYNQIKNNKDYFDQRVAKWDAELKDIGLKTAPPRRPNEQRPMGFEGYIKYLDSNIKQLQTQELTQELTQKELESGKNPSVNQYQLKTLIAFHYLEKAKVLYSSGKLHLDGIEGGHFKKESVFNEVPELYRSYLFDSKFKISQNSYTLPNLEKEPTPEVLQFSSELNIKPPMSARVKNAMNNALDATKEAFEDEASFIKNEMGGRRVLEGVKAVGSGIRSVTSNVVIGALDRAGGAIEWTGVRATPAEMTMPNKIKDDTGLGYKTTFPSVYAHDSRLRKEKHKASILERDTQPDELARNQSQRRSERGLAMHSQAGGRNFHGPYNSKHGGKNGGR